jgi:hypothetical protein
MLSNKRPLGGPPCDQNREKNAEGQQKDIEKDTQQTVASHVNAF